MITPAGRYDDDRSQKVLDFLMAVIELSKTHGLSISHEDHHGGFQVANYDESLSDWLNDAADTTKSEVVQ